MVFTHLSSSPYTVTSVLRIQVNEFVDAHARAHGKSPEPYMTAIESAASLVDLTRNPYLLNLFVHAFPALPRASPGRLARITRYRVYEAFVTQWFMERGVGRLPEGATALLGMPCIPEVVSRFDLLSALLAGEMLKYRELELSVVLGQPGGPSCPRAQAWVRVQDTAVDWLVGRELEEVKASRHYRAASRRDKVLLEDNVAGYVYAAIDKFASSCPLHRSGDAVEFVHKSFMEYFGARLVLLAAGSDWPLETRVTRASCVMTLPTRRIQDEPEVLRFLADAWQDASQDSAQGATVSRVRETLLKLVADSARPPGAAGLDGAAGPGPGGAAANAATILNWMGDQLCNLRWDRVVLDGADLTWAVLRGTRLAGASLRGCLLGNAILADVDLDGADLRDVNFGDCAPLLGHGGEVTSVTLGYGRDRRALVASGSRDGTLRVWERNLEGDAVGCPLLGHSGAVVSVAFGELPDDHHQVLVASCGEDGTVRVWDAVSRAAVSVIGADVPHARRSWLTSVAFCAGPDGRLVLVSGAGDGKVHTWDALSGEPLREPFAGHTSLVTSVAVAAAPGGGPARVVSGSTDGTARVWDLASGEAGPCPVVPHGKPVSSVALGVHPTTGRLLAASGCYDWKVRVWDLESGEALTVPLAGHGDRVTSVSFCATASDGRLLLVSGSLDWTVRVWDALSGAAVGAPLVGHTNKVTSVAIGPVFGMDSDRWGVGAVLVVSGGGDAQVRIWDAASTLVTKVPMMGHTREVRSVACEAVLRPDGREQLLIASGGSDKTTRLWDASSGAALGAPLVGQQDKVTGIALGVGPSGQVLVAVSGDSGSGSIVSVWEAQASVLATASLPFPGRRATSVAFGRRIETGTQLLAVGFKDGCALVHDIGLEHEHAPGTSTGLAGGQPGAASGHLLKVEGKVTGVALGRCPRTLMLHLATSGSDKAVRLWRMTYGPRPLTLTEVRALLGHERRVTCVALCHGPNKQLWIASGSEDWTVRLWDADTGAAVREPLRGHAERVTSVACGVTPRDHRLVIVSGGADRAVRVWDALSGVSVVLAGHASAVASVAVGSRSSSSQMLVVSGGVDGTVRVWEWASIDSGHPYGGLAPRAALLWASRAPSQTLDVRGMRSAACVGLSRAQQARLRAWEFVDTFGVPSFATYATVTPGGDGTWWFSLREPYQFGSTLHVNVLFFAGQRIFSAGPLSFYCGLGAACTLTKLCFPSGIRGRDFLLQFFVSCGS
jgi:WD40 repeat protein